MDEIAVEFDGRAKITKINAPENFETSGNFGIRAMPTILIFKDGNVVDQSVGFRDKNDIAKMLEAAIG